MVAVGATVGSNPTEIAVQEARLLAFPTKPGCIVSIGVSPIENEQNSGTFAKLAISAEENHNRVLGWLPPDAAYFRLAPQLSPPDLELVTSKEKQEAAVSIAKQYFTDRKELLDLLQSAIAKSESVI